MQAAPGSAQRTVEPAPRTNLPTAQAQPAPGAHPNESAGAAASCQQQRWARAEEVPLPVALAPLISLLLMPFLLSRFGN